MRALPAKCRDINAVASFCECISNESSADVAAEAFCKRAFDGTSRVTGDDVVELKKALSDLDTAEEDDSCCEC